MADLKLNENAKEKPTIYFPAARTIYKLTTTTTNDEQTTKGKETAYFFESTNNIITNENTKFANINSTPKLFMNNTASNKINKALAAKNCKEDEQNSLKNDDLSETVKKTSNKLNPARNGVPSFNVFFRELKNVKKTDPRLRKSISFTYFH